MLYQLDNVISGSVVKRPSKHIKTPYVADVLVEASSISSEVLAHSASLGCCGLANAGASILMTPMPIPKSKNTKQKCQYRIYLALYKERGHEMIIGIHPKLAEDLVENALKQNILSLLSNTKSYKRETKVFIEGKVDSRFDFSGVDKNDVPFIMEVKNVPLADYEDVTSKDRKKMDFSGREFANKVAYFPDGYRKKTTDPVSPRALKHIRELSYIKSTSNTRCIMCYVIQRTDVDRFTPSVIDPEYRQALKEALELGVEIITLVVKWTLNNEKKEAVAEFVRDDLPVIF